MALIRKDGKKKRSALFLREDTIEALRCLTALHGTPAAEIVRRALDSYLETRQDEIKQGRKLLRQG